MLNKLRKLREKKGFTLVELIVVIAIIAILTAVLVPLVGNYTSQAAYTTLQDAAQTISNNANNALSNAAITTPVTHNCITGSKNSVGFKVSVGSVNESGAFTAATDDTATKVANELTNTLSNTLPAKCAFLISVSNGAVTGVVYVNSTDEIKTGTIAHTTDAQHGQPNDGKDFFQLTATTGGAITPVGVSGTYKNVTRDAANKEVSVPVKTAVAANVASKS